jgi:hypothetical protein
VIRHLSAAALLLVIACEKNEAASNGAASASASPSVSAAPPPSETATAAAPAPSAPPLRDEPAIIAYRDQDRLLGSAWAFTEGGSALRIAVSTHQRFCDNVHAQKIVTQNHELFFGATIVNMLDGKSGEWQRFISDNRFGNRHHTFAKPGDGGELKILGGSAAKGDTLRVQLRTTAGGATLNGVVTARGCGDLFEAHDPVPELSGVTLTVAGKSHPLRSARVQHSGKTNVLVLSSAPAGCRDRGTHGDAQLTVNHVEGPHPVEVYLAGDMYASSRLAPAELSKVKVELEQDPTTFDYRFKLEAELKIGDYETVVKAAGTAADCP